MRDSKGRDESFEAFFAAESRSLERFATLLVGDPSRGADLAQEALARVYARWGRVGPQWPGAYARQAVLNLVRSAHRARTVRARTRVPAWARADRGRGEPSPQERLPESLRMVEVLGELSPRQRAAVVLRFYEDASLEEIARILDRPVGTVKSDLHRALRQLRALLEGSASEGTTR